MNPVQSAIEARVGYVVDWGASAGWAQAIGGAAALWAAARLMVLQQRRARQQVLEGVVATLGSAHDLLRLTADTARSAASIDVWRYFDLTRFDDQLAAIALIGPSTVIDERLTQLVSAYPRLLKTARKEASACQDATLRGQPTRRYPIAIEDMDVLDRCVRESGEHLAEAARILGAARRQRRAWLIR